MIHLTMGVAMPDKKGLEQTYDAFLDGLDDANAALDEKVDAAGWSLTQVALSVEDALLRAASGLASRTGSLAAAGKAALQTRTRASSRSSSR